MPPRPDEQSLGASIDQGNAAVSSPPEDCEMHHNVEPIDFARSLPAATSNVLSASEVRLLAATDWTRNFATWSVFLQFPPPGADVVIDGREYWTWPHFAMWRREFRERVAAYSRRFGDDDEPPAPAPRPRRPLPRKELIAA
jgi:hypothetical protein